jgi:hypothetical protein
MALAEKPEPIHEANMPRSYDDVRQWLDLVEKMGELKRVNGADWNLEIGTIAELIYRERSGTIPALLFDHIKGYPEGFRILFGQQTSYRRLALMAGLPMDSVGLKLVGRFKEKLNKLQPIPPRMVKTGPVFENMMAGDAIDILKFPVPKVHESDGGRFIGTACIAVTRDPEDGWLNLGTYRAMVHDANSVGLFMSSAGKHGRMHMEKYFKQGKPCPAFCASAKTLCYCWPRAIPSSLVIPNTITAAASEADPTISSKVKSLACPFPPTRRLPSRDSFIPATSNPMDRSANGSAITAPGWRTRRCCASNVFIIATIRSYA